MALTAMNRAMFPVRCPRHLKVAMAAAGGGLLMAVTGGLAV